MARSGSVPCCVWVFGICVWEYPISVTTMLQVGQVLIDRWHPEMAFGLGPLSWTAAISLE